MDAYLLRSCNPFGLPNKAGNDLDKHFPLVNKL